jgi:primase-polymerase (primpol)-like protein
LKDLRQFVSWRYEEKDGHVTKVPTCPHNGELAAVDRPETWGTYQEAVQAASNHSNDGVGFVFTEDDPYTGVDLDKCRNPETGELEEWARKLVEDLGSYTELSPSGTGVHILIKATLPSGGRRKGQIEMYDSGRFFTITGRHLPGTPKVIKECQVEVSLWAPRCRMLECRKRTIHNARDLGAHGVERRVDFDELIEGLEDLDWSELARLEGALKRRLRELGADGGGGSGRSRAS